MVFVPKFGFLFLLSRSISQACRRGSGSFEPVYYVLHDASSGIGMGVSIGSIRLQILTALFLFVVLLFVIFIFATINLLNYYYIVLYICITAPWRP